MLYCFIREDLENIAADDPLMIQSVYARKINSFCMLDLSTGTIVDQKNRAVALSGKRVFLRGSCDCVSSALNLLQQYNCDLLETEQDIQKILYWELLHLTKRRVISLKVGDMLTGCLPDDARAMLAEHEAVFIKSREKGFSARVASSRLLNRDPAVMAVIERHCTPDTDVLMSELMHIKGDSLGKKESRHFVVHNQTLNSSRPIHSLMHTVPKTLLRETKNIVDQIAQIEDFPDTYVIDTGLVERNGETVVDIIELNPISSAMCYVNNSIFTEVIPELSNSSDTVSFGKEYQLDMLSNPSRYTRDRCSGKLYEYLSSEQYEFL